MKINDELGTRMKHNYEETAKYRLLRRMPVAIRIDGKAFHTFTRKFVRPFDEVFMNAMQNTMKDLCENIQGCVLGYTQSDEITLILTDYAKFTSDAWFDYEVQKLASVSAAMATLYFHKEFQASVEAFNKHSYQKYLDTSIQDAKEEALLCIYDEAINKGAVFDSRCFNIPKEEVTNLLYWRQLDATRNSIQSVGQANFSQKELQGKSANQIQDMLFMQKGINWNDLSIDKKRGSCCVKKQNLIHQEARTEDVEYQWIIDKEIPQFKGDGRNYIEKLINFEEK